MRISLLKSVSKRQKEHDPNAVCSVSSFTARPMLRVGGGKDKGTRFLNFVDAMAGFRHLLTREDLDKAASLCQNLRGHLKSRFLVLSDDRVPPPPPNKKRPRSDLAQDGGNMDGESSVAGKRLPPRTGGNAQPIGVPPARTDVAAPATAAYSFAQNNSSLIAHQPLGALPTIPEVVTANSAAYSFAQTNPSLGQVQQPPNLSSPNSFPPLSFVSGNPSAVTTPAPLGVEAGFQVVSGRGGRRSSQRSTPVAGVQKIKNKSGGRTGGQSHTQDRFEAARGLTEILSEDQDQMNISDASPTAFVDATEEI